MNQPDGRDVMSLSCDELDRFAMERPVTTRRIVPLQDGETADQFGLHLAILDGQEVLTNAFGTIAIPVGHREETDDELRARIREVYGSRWSAIGEEAGVRSQR